MKRLWLGLAAAILALVGCDGDDESASQEPTETRPFTEADFIGLTREEVPSLAAGRDDAGLVSAAASTCEMLKPEDTQSWLRAVKALTMSGVAGREARTFIVYATATYCPQDASAAP